jgi:hypothetical protein
MELLKLSVYCSLSFVVLFKKGPLLFKCNRCVAGLKELLKRGTASRCELLMGIDKKLKIKLLAGFFLFRQLPANSMVKA